ncbi:methyl-accepting chemotaxis protein [Pandoraea sp.]|uniref:methyl-accepting chemotaxis protein n=1 Tax=Pandoraea sp. TaxID=1883445 RepID=UPI0035B42460
MQRFTLNTKLLLALGLMWISLLVICAWGSFHTRQTMIDERELGLKSVVDSATSVIKRYADAVDKGTLTKADAQRDALAQVRAMRFGESGYLSVSDTHNNVVMHPIKPELDGKNLAGFKDPAGNYVFREISKIGRTGGGYFTYLWPKPGHDKPVGKISRVGYFAPWDWCVTGGVYTDDINDAFYRSLAQWAGLLVVLGGIVSAAMLLIIRNIKKSLGGEPHYAVEIASRIAEGDLTMRVDVKPGDTASLLAAMRRMQESLSSTVERIRGGTESITSAAREIAAGNTDLSARTEEQAASLEETASSMEQLTATVKQNADNARQASAMAVNASEIAARGGSVVGQVVGTMQDIASSSSKVVDIISVIDGIAFQTNILALNAAVEAARAGEQGRGFAVVAGEVRTLAQRSAAAAKEIKALIESSAQQVRAGSTLVEQAGKTMEDIVQAVQRVTDIMGEISAASSEQSHGIEQVNRAVTQMDEVTQQNAALVEEAAAAAASMEEQATRLQGAVTSFQIASAPAAEVRITERPYLVSGKRLAA